MQNVWITCGNVPNKLWNLILSNDVILVSLANGIFWVSVFSTHLPLISFVRFLFFLSFLLLWFGHLFVWLGLIEHIDNVRKKNRVLFFTTTMKKTKTLRRVCKVDDKEIHENDKEKAMTGNREDLILLLYFTLFANDY